MTPGAMVPIAEAIDQARTRGLRIFRTECSGIGFSHEHRFAAAGEIFQAIQSGSQNGGTLPKKRSALAKPIIVLKVGHTDTAAKAAASHTGALTGNFGKPGTGVNPLRGQNNAQGVAHMGCEPGNLTGFVSLDQGRDLFESEWPAPVPHARELNLMQMMDAAADQKLKALWTIGYDVALTNPNAAATKAALAKLDLVIVQDLFVNELAREFGHVFLPACSSFEKDGTFMNSERRVQRVRQAMEPVGNSKADWEIICAVAKAMIARSRRRKEAGNGGSSTHPPPHVGGYTGFDFNSAEEIWNEVRAVWKAGTGISYARLEHGGLQWPCPTEDHPGTTILHAKKFPNGLRAPLKRIEFSASEETVSPNSGSCSRPAARSTNSTPAP